MTIKSTPNCCGLLAAIPELTVTKEEYTPGDKFDVSTATFMIPGVLPFKGETTSQDAPGVALQSKFSNPRDRTLMVFEDGFAAPAVALKMIFLGNNDKLGPGTLPVVILTQAKSAFGKPEGDAPTKIASREFISC